MALQRQVACKMLSKRDQQKEQEALAWIYEILGEPVPSTPYEKLLKDGVVLCNLMNKLSPGCIKTINHSDSHFKCMENINKFTAAAQAYGVPVTDLFQTVDLFEQKDISAVTGTLFALGRTTYKHPEWTGPWLGPRPAEANVREWTEEQLRASEGIIGIQAGSNKFATQAGQNIGATRKVLINK